MYTTAGFLLHIAATFCCLSTGGLRNIGKCRKPRNSFFSLFICTPERESVASSNDFVAHAAFLAPTDGQNVASRLEAWRPALVLVDQSNHTDWSHGRIKTKSGLMRQQWRCVRYDTRCYFNVRSKADISQLNLPHGTDN